MNEESSSGERNLHLVAKIVGRYVTHHEHLKYRVGSIH
jgi:hypothetical protein